jgi:hypothetical protein
MAVARWQAYYDKAKVTGIKSFRLDAPVLMTIDI